MEEFQKLTTVLFSIWDAINNNITNRYCISLNK